MKLFKFTTWLMLGLALTFVASGCRRAPKGVTQIPGATSGHPGGEGSSGIIQPVENPGGTGTTGGEGTATPMGDPSKHAGWHEDASTFEANTVHFAYDSSVVRSDDKSKIAAVADYLKANGNAAVRVEGHCDERGTDEYNRALGERRAGAVREELIHLGIAADRVDTVSFGRNRPIDNSGTEEGRSRNRRGVFILLTPP